MVLVNRPESRRPRKWGWPFLAGILVGTLATKAMRDDPTPCPHGAAEAGAGEVVTGVDQGASVAAVTRARVARAGAGSVTESGSESVTGSGSDTESGSDTKSVTGSGSASGSDSGAAFAVRAASDSTAGSDSWTAFAARSASASLQLASASVSRSGSDAASRSGSGTDSGSDTDTDTDTASGSDAASDSASRSGSDSDSDSDTDSGSASDSNTPPRAEPSTALAAAPALRPALAPDVFVGAPLTPVHAAPAPTLEPLTANAHVGPMPPVVPIADLGPPAPITGKIRSGERVADVLERAGVSVLEIDRALATLTGKVDFTKTRVGDRYVVEPASHGKLARFVYETSPLNAWTVRADGDGYVAAKKDVKVERVVTLVEGEVGSSLYQAFIDAGEGPALAMQLAHVYRYDIDFNTETRKGDRFRLYVEKDEVEGETVGYGRILAAEYGARRLFELDGAYYDEKGKAAKKAFLKSPLAFTRISSAYGYRTHPITKRKHFHGGVDYAAPTGTPVQSVADGVVTFAARKGPNGKMVKVRHPGGYESYYLHLSRILVKRGQRVSQSTLVGRVGSTGRSTGPHLDFRLKQNGKYLNPTKKVAARHFGVPKKSRKKFRALVKKWGHRLDGSERLVMAGKGSHLP